MLESSSCISVEPSLFRRCTECRSSKRPRSANSPEQKAWEAYRDAQLAALYPRGDVSSYGSVYPLCLAILKKALTEGRIRDLKALTTSGEGDACYGYRASSNKRN